MRIGLIDVDFHTFPNLPLRKKELTLLGHENIGTTQIYLDISDKELEQAHEKWVI